MAAAVGCLRSVNTSWAVPGAQDGGAHPIASSSLNMLTTGAGGTLGCRHRKNEAVGAPCAFPAPPHVGHPMLKRCAPAPYLPILVSMSLNVHLCLSPSPSLSDSVTLSLTHTSACMHASIRKKSFIRVNLEQPYQVRHSQTPIKALSCPWVQRQGSPCRKLPEWKTVVLQASGKQAPPLAPILGN